MSIGHRYRGALARSDPIVTIQPDPQSLTQERYMNTSTNPPTLTSIGSGRPASKQEDIREGGSGFSRAVS